VNANSAACQFYGYSLKAIKQLKITDINTLPDDKVLIEMEKAKTEKRLFFCFKHRLSSGEIRDIEVHSGKINTNDKDYLYSIINDVTQRNQYEKELENSKTYLNNIILGTDAGTWEWNITTGETVFSVRAIGITNIMERLAASHRSFTCNSPSIQMFLRCAQCSG